MGFEFLSSRLGTAWGSNALDQDHYILSAAWYSHPNKPLHFVSRLKAGLFRVPLEEEIFADLPQESIYLAPEFGLSYELAKLPLSLNLNLGYLLDFAPAGESPGTLQPLHYNLRIFYHL